MGVGSFVRFVNNKQGLHSFFFPAGTVCLQYVVMAGWLGFSRLHQTKERICLLLITVPSKVKVQSYAEQQI